MTPTLLKSARKATILTFPSTRPMPPKSASGAGGPAFQSAPDLERWIRGTFLVEGAGLFNSDHVHLNEAVIGVLWAGIENTRQMRRILATAEDPAPIGGGAWKTGRIRQQLEEWFGGIPDFLITISAPWAEATDNRSFCAVIEHELYHCAQALDEFGGPKFHQDGSPWFAIRGHDVEEFIGVAQRYGLPKDLHDLLKQADQMPKIPNRMIDGVCGTCIKKAA